MTELMKVAVTSQAGIRLTHAREQTEMEAELWHTKTHPDSSQEVEGTEG